MEGAQIRILIVDDHLVFSQALQTALSAREKISVVGLAADGKSARKSLVSLRPDLVILDYGFPDEEGMTIAESLKEIDPDIPIILLTAFSEVRLLLESMRVGISGFLSKEQPVDDVVEMIYTVADQGSALSDTLLKSVLSKMEQNNWEVRPPNENFGLTPRELTILQELSYGRALQNIADSLYISGNTVRTHLEHILSKMDVHSRLEAVSLAIRSKLISAPRTVP